MMKPRDVLTASYPCVETGESPWVRSGVSAGQLVFHRKFVSNYVQMWIDRRDGKGDS